MPEKIRVRDADTETQTSVGECLWSGLSHWFTGTAMGATLWPEINGSEGNV